MNCDKAQKAILTGGASEPKVAEHIANCAACAIFADSLERFSPAKPDESTLEVPPYLDEKVKLEARDFLAEHPPRRPVDQEVRYGNFASYFAMAATIVLVSWLFISLLFPKHASLDGKDGQTVLAGRSATQNASANAVSLSWDDKRVDDDFFSIDADIEFTFALMTISPDDDTKSDSGDDSDDDTRFKVVIPDLLT